MTDRTTPPISDGCYGPGDDPYGEGCDRTAPKHDSYGWVVVIVKLRSGDEHHGVYCSAECALPLLQMLARDLDDELADLITDEGTGR